MFKERRFGELIVSGQVLADDPLLFANVVMQNCVVVRCEHHFIKNEFEYRLWSSDFDIVPLGSLIPRYDAIITKHTPDPDVPDAVHYTRQWEKRKW